MKRVSGRGICKRKATRGMYKYKKALDEGKSKKEAREISQTKGRK